MNVRKRSSAETRKGGLAITAVWQMLMTSSEYRDTLQKNDNKIKAEATAQTF